MKYWLEPPYLNETILTLAHNHPAGRARVAATRGSVIAPNEAFTTISWIPF